MQYSPVPWSFWHQRPSKDLDEKKTSNHTRFFRQYLNFRPFSCQSRISWFTKSHFVHLSTYLSGLTLLRKVIKMVICAFFRCFMPNEFGHKPAFQTCFPKHFAVKKGFTYAQAQQTTPWDFNFSIFSCFICQKIITVVRRCILNDLKALFISIWPDIFCTCNII